MSENIFQQVRGINELAGNKLATQITDLLKQGNIIKSELYEFLQGIADGDLREIRDGQGDIIFTALGLPGRSGYPFARDLQTICDNQFAKFDSSITDAEKTRDKYAAEGVETTWHQDQYEGITYYVTTSAKDQMYKGKPIGKGKWLKSWKWGEPEFAEVDAVRTPWIGTELPTGKLLELQAELAVQGWIAKMGAVQVELILRMGNELIENAGHDFDISAIHTISDLLKSVNSTTAAVMKSNPLVFAKGNAVPDGFQELVPALSEEQAAAFLAADDEMKAALTQIGNKNSTDPRYNYGATDANSEIHTTTLKA